MSIMRSMMGAACALGLFAAAQPAAAEWPEKPITMVMPFSPGGGLDQTLLPLKPLIEKRIGQNLLFTYKEGASGQIGWEIMHDKNDAYTIGALVVPHFPNTTVFSSPKYTLDDFVPVAVVTQDVPLWFVHKDSPIQNMKDLIAEAKKRPNGVTVAIGSFNGEHYIGMKLLEERAGIDLREVNVKGGGKVMSNISGKHMEVGISRPSSMLPIRDVIRGIAVIDERRNDLFPEAGTMDEQLPEMKIPHMSVAFGIMAPRGFRDSEPKGFAKLVQAVKEAMEEADFKAAMDRQGRPITYMGPERGLKLVKDTADQMKEYQPLIEAAKKGS